MTPALRLRAIAVSIAIVAGVVTAHRFLPYGASSLLTDAIQTLHGPGFALVAVVIFLLLKNQNTVHSRYMRAAAAACLLGLLSEISQIPGPRDAQISDLVVDGFGIFGALGLIASFDAKVQPLLGKFRNYALRGLSSLALAIIVAPTIWATYLVTMQNSAFPKLVTFEHRWEHEIFGAPPGKQSALIAAPSGWPVDSGTVAQVYRRGSRGIFFSLHPVRDWRNYSAVSFTAATSGRALALVVGIRDLDENHKTKTVVFYKNITVTNIPTTFFVTFDEIQKTQNDRPFDFSNVEALVFSAADAKGKDPLLIDDVQLVR